MQLVRSPDDLAEFGFPWLPTEDDLPCDDGEPMETQRHVMQMFLLIETLRSAWADRSDVFIGGNMFLYFSVEQVRGRDFRGPDFFVALDVERRERKSWVVWQEGKGPDVIIELLSESTAAVDKGEKKQVYQDTLAVPEYFWYDPFSGELAGFSLRDSVYEPIEPDIAGRLPSRRLGLSLVRWPGQYANIDATWLRWATLDGTL
ncbi:MAG: Uma2 family endonuclease, partial [Dehalococcoidia bacterium]